MDGDGARVIGSRATDFSPSRRAWIALLSAGAGLAICPPMLHATASSDLDALTSLRLAELDYEPEPAALTRTWKELVTVLESVRAHPSRVETVRLLKHIGKVYTWQTWNFEYLDSDFWFDVCAANHALFAHHGQMRKDQAFAHAQLILALDKLRRAVSRASGTLPPRDPTGAVARFRENAPPPLSAPLIGESLRDGYELLWGDLHVHSALSYDAFLSPAHCYRFAREVMAFDFAVLTDHAFRFGHPGHPYFAAPTTDMFDFVFELADRFRAPGVFETLSGLEWEGRFAQGHRQLIFAPGTRPSTPYSLVNPDTNSIKRLWDALDRNRDRALTIAHHSAYAENAMGNALMHWNDDYQRLIEVTSDNGLFERMGDAIPATEGGVAVAGRTVSDALSKGMRLGLVGDSDGHLGMPGLYVEGVTGFGGRPGFTGVWVRSRRAEDLYEALCARRCYATDGERILLHFSVNGHPMGSELVVPPTAALMIEIVVAAARRIREVELLDNEHSLRRWALDTDSVRLEFEIRGEAGHVTALAGTRRTVNQYRVRVNLFNGRRAWSSPIWIDYGV